MSIMSVDGHKAKIEEFKNSLEVFLEVRKEKGIQPYKEYSGKFNFTRKT